MIWFVFASLHLVFTVSTCPSAWHKRRSETVFAADTWERVVFHDSWHRFLHHASLAAYHASQASAKQVEDRALLKIAAAFYDEMFAPDQPAITPIPVGMRFLGSAQFCR